MRIYLSGSQKNTVRCELENTLLDLCKLIKRIAEGPFSEENRFLPELVKSVAELTTAISNYSSVYLD